MDNREFFNGLAHRWDEISKPKTHNLKRIIDLTGLDVAKKILDVGTGTGVMVPHLLDKEPQIVVGIDMSDRMIDIAKDKFGDRGVEFVVGDVMALDMKELDCIMLHNVYPHIEDKEALFEKAESMLADKGILVVAHSSSRDEINGIHSGNAETQEDRLSPAAETAAIMAKYFSVRDVVDDDHIYFVKGVKEGL